MTRPDAKPRSGAWLLAGLLLALVPLLAGAQLGRAEPAGPSFTVTPEAPLPGQTVTFSATGVRSSEPVRWDFDGDGTFDAMGATAQFAYTTPGQKTVLMRVTRTNGAVVDATKVVRVDAPPTASFTATPNPASVGQTVQFNAGASSDPDGAIASYAWDLDNDGQFDDASGVTASRAFAAAGTQTVRLRVTDSRGVTDDASAVVTVNALPVPPAPPPNQVPLASFTATPNPARVGQTVQFNASGSSDPDGTIASYAWDLDNDGQFDDASGVTASGVFAAGTHTVGLRVTDNRGAADTAVVTVNVPPPVDGPAANSPPVASFTILPARPVAGDAVTLTSTSSDAEGPIASHAWDLDDDGQFDDSSSRSPGVRFLNPGTYVVSLRVTDGRGAADVEARTIVVGASAGPATLMTPFPVVRIVGRSIPGGARIRLLVVKGAPRGAKVTVRCRGRGCPRRGQRKFVRSGGVRFRAFERRVRVGVRIQVYVTQLGSIGKYTSFKIRLGRSPLRRDLCVTSVRAKPKRCPSS